MNDERDPQTDKSSDALPSVEQIGKLDAYLDRLVADRRPAARDLSADEVQAHILATQLRLARDGVEVPTQEFLQNLEQKIGNALANERQPRRRPGLSRGRFLRGMATLAGGVGLGVAAVEGAIAIEQVSRPQTLVAAGNERWYDIAASDEVPEGGMKPFSAGGLLGYLINDAGHLHAVSGICTHMGCRLKPAASAQGPAGLSCLCHGSTFRRNGDVVEGLAPTALPKIAVRVEKGRVLALGTRETV